LNRGTARAADLHPIVEIETGYFFGASEKGKSISSDQASKSVANIRTQIIAGEVYPKWNESVAPNVHDVAAVLDLNGDEKLEVIVHSFYYEGGQTKIYRCQPDKIEEVLSVECGA